MEKEGKQDPSIAEEEDDEGVFLDENGEEQIIIDATELLQENGEGDGEAGTEAADDEEQFEDDSVQAFGGHTDSVYAVAINPENPDQIVSGGGDDRAFIWSLKTGEPISELKGHTDSVSQVAYNWDGKLIATAGLDGTARIWNSADGSLVRTLEGPGEGLEWLAWHPKGNILLAGTEGGSAWMWLTANGSCLQVFSGHELGQVCTCGAFTPDGKKVVTGSADGTLRVWNPKTGASELTLAGKLFHEAGVSTLAIHHEQPLLITGSVDHTGRLVNLASGKVLGAFRGHTEPVEAVGFCRTQPFAATGSVDNTIRIWDVNTLGLRLTCQHDDGVTRLMWHPTQPLLFSASMDRTVRLWDARTGKAERVFRGHANAILTMDVARDGNTVVTGSDDHHCLAFSVLDE